MLDLGLCKLTRIFQGEVATKARMERLNQMISVETIEKRLTRLNAQARAQWYDPDWKWALVLYQPLVDRSARGQTQNQIVNSGTTTTAGRSSYETVSWSFANDDQTMRTSTRRSPARVGRSEKARGKPVKARKPRRRHGGRESVIFGMGGAVVRLTRCLSFSRLLFNHRFKKTTADVRIISMLCVWTIQ